MPEGKTLEFKRDLSSLRPVLRTLVIVGGHPRTLVVKKLDEAGVTP
jgi:hypothetical protein